MNEILTSRCAWVGADPLYEDYHDTEWGVPERDSRALFEKLVLDGFQAGLSWITILRKREAFRAAFAGFDPEVLAGWGEGEVDVLVQNAGIIRHRGKINATLSNARAYLEIEAQGGFDRFLWDYVEGTPLYGGYASHAEVPTFSDLSTQISKDLRKAGFKFVGPTIVYAFMEACGLFNNHTTGCFRCAQVRAMAL